MKTVCPNLKKKRVNEQFNTVKKYREFKLKNYKIAAHLNKSLSEKTLNCSFKKVLGFST